MDTISKKIAYALESEQTGGQINMCNALEELRQEVAIRKHYNNMNPVVLFSGQIWCNTGTNGKKIGKNVIILCKKQHFIGAFWYIKA